jgi:uncharacterized protein
VASGIIRHLPGSPLSDLSTLPTILVTPSGRRTRPTRHAEILGELIVSYQLRGNLGSDAQLAALAIEHGLTVCSADTDFARFSEIRWHNPLAPS